MPHAQAELAGVSQASWRVAGRQAGSQARRLGGSVAEAGARVCGCMHTGVHSTSASGTCGGTTGRPKQLQLKPRAVRAQPLPPCFEAGDEPLALERREDGDAQLHPTW